MKNVVPSIKKFRKEKVVELRKKGYSYSDIQKLIDVPRSTLSFWLKTVQLTEEQTGKLKERRIKAAKKNSEKRIQKTASLIKKIQETSSHDVGKISLRELWLIGIILYWRERLVNGNGNDLKNGVRFTSSDPVLIKLFLKWLREVGKISSEEIKFDLFLKNFNSDKGTDDRNETNSVEKIKRAVLYWSRATGFPKEKFLDHIYFQNIDDPKRSNGKLDDKDLALLNLDKKSVSSSDPSKKEKPHLGFLRIRVRSSSMLARQISGWVKGIINYYRL